MSDRYDSLMEILTWRRSIRRYKNKPVSDEALLKICDAGHYAMAGGNSQPWEFIIVKDTNTIEALRKVYEEGDFRWTYWLEQQRSEQYRHPAFNFPQNELEERARKATEQLAAPAIICLMYDPRKQFGSVLSARADMADGSQSVISCTMGGCCMTMQIAAASLGLSSARCDCNQQDGYRKVLGYPEPVFLYAMMPVGYRDYEPGPPKRLPLENLIHYEHYDTDKYMENDEVLKHILKIRGQYGKI